MGSPSSRMTARICPGSMVSSFSLVLTKLYGQMTPRRSSSASASGVGGMVWLSPRVFISARVPSDAHATKSNGFLQVHGGGTVAGQKKRWWEKPGKAVETPSLDRRSSNSEGSVTSG